ncbi:MAG: glycerol-3-phosphate dehydrogenase/oxidase [Planctomycetota bacterium]
MEGLLRHRTPPPRARRLEELLTRPLDVLVVGGGVTGAGIALDLVARGLSAGLVERGDWAGATSSASSSLVHGGLRYLEQLELGLVRESCLERGFLLRNAAGFVWPERFTFPVRRGDRVGRARLLAGLWLYTAVSLPRALGLPRALSAAEVARRIPGMDPARLRGGGGYLDGATDDARLTLAIVLTALSRGALPVSRLELLALEAGSRGVAALLLDRLDQSRHEVRARAAVLAGGPFTDRLRSCAGLAGAWVRPTRGSHLALPREALPTDGAVIFPSPVDGRVLFLLPTPTMTILGTTDLDADPAAEVRATAAEVDYLLASAQDLVPGARLGREDVLVTWSGLRPLLATNGRAPSARSREERAEREGPIWTIAGGKLTAWRATAEKLGARLAAWLERGDCDPRSPTRGILLRGARPHRARRPTWSALGPEGTIPAPRDPLSEARDRRYGRLAPAVAAFAAARPGGESSLGADTQLGEVDWAVAHEDCLSAADFLFRRTKLALAPRARAQAAGEAVIGRLADLAGWDEPRRVEERRALGAAIARLHAWREDP